MKSQPHRSLICRGSVRTTGSIRFAWTQNSCLFSSGNAIRSACARSSSPRVSGPRSTVIVCRGLSSPLLVPVASSGGGLNGYSSVVWIERCLNLNRTRSLSMNLSSEAILGNQPVRPTKTTTEK